MSKKYIELEQATKKIGSIGNLADFIKDVICDELTELPTIEVSEECISREYLLSKVYDMDNDNLVVDLKDIENAPSVVPNRAEGEWIRNFDGNEWYWYCTNCKTQWYEEDLWMGGNEFPNYCPNCGADMRGEEETPTCSECDHYEDHHTSLACANCPVITKVWGGKENE